MNPVMCDIRGNYYSDLDFQNKMIASIGNVLKLHSWSENQLEPVTTFIPKRNAVAPETKMLNVSWCHDNSYIALLQEECQPQIVSSKDRANLSLVHTITAMKLVTAITFKNNTKRSLALGNKAGEVVIYDTKNRSISSKIADLLAPVKQLEFNCKDDQLAVLFENNVSIFTDGAEAVKEIREPVGCTTIRYHPTQAAVIGVGSETGCVAVWDAGKEEKVHTYQKHSAPVTGIAFTAAQRTMVTTGMDNKICVIDNSSSDCAFRMNIHQAVTSVDISPDDLYIACALEDGCVYIYDIRDTLKPLVCTNCHSCPINKIVFANGPMSDEVTKEKHSVTTINESEFGDNNQFEAIASLDDLHKREHSNKHEHAVKHENVEDRLKKELLKTVKSQISYLENQLQEHCAKFQAFINNEFDSIHNAMSRWDVFNVGDTSEIVQAIDSAGSKTMKSCSSHKSNNCHLPI